MAFAISNGTTTDVTQLGSDDGSVGGDIGSGAGKFRVENPPLLWRQMSISHL